MADGDFTFIFNQWNSPIKTVYAFDMYIWKEMFLLLLQQFLQASEGSVAFQFNIVILTEHVYAWINIKQYVRKFLQ